jgi:cobalt-zinc-cadmium efflux system protein
LHDHARGLRTGFVLKLSLLATIAFVVLEAAAGIRSHSLALLSDAGHNVTDALALLLAWFAFYFQAKPPDEVKTFGYHRSGVLAAFVNALTLIGLSLWIFYESYHRLLAPQQVQETTMMVIAALGIVLNGGIMWGLHASSRHDINVRSAFVHMLGDLLGSIGIIAGALVIRWTGWERVDPILSIGIGGLIIWTAWGIIRESLNILLEGLPRGLKLKTVIEAMEQVEGVIDIHDLHIWSLGSSTHALSCHVLIDDVPPSASEALLQRLNRLLDERFHIHHTTVQFEHARCPLSQNGCVIPSGCEHER